MNVEDITENMPEDGTEYYSVIDNMQTYRVNICDMGDAAYDVYIHDSEGVLVKDGELFAKLEAAVEKYKKENK